MLDHIVVALVVLKDEARRRLNIKGVEPAVTISEQRLGDYDRAESLLRTGHNHYFRLKNAHKDVPAHSASKTDSLIKLSSPTRIPQPRVDTEK